MSDREHHSRGTCRLHHLRQVLEGPVHVDAHHPTVLQAPRVVEEPDHPSCMVQLNVLGQCHASLTGAEHQESFVGGSRLCDEAPAKQPGPETQGTCHAAAEHRGHDRDGERNGTVCHPDDREQDAQDGCLCHQDLPRLEHAGELQHAGVEPHDAVGDHGDQENDGQECQVARPRLSRDVSVIAQQQGSRPRGRRQKDVSHDQRHGHPPCRCRSRMYELHRTGPPLNRLVLPRRTIGRFEGLTPPPIAREASRVNRPFPLLLPSAADVAPVTAVREISWTVISRETPGEPGGDSA